MTEAVDVDVEEAFFDERGEIRFAHRVPLFIRDSRREDARECNGVIRGSADLKSSGASGMDDRRELCTVGDLADRTDANVRIRRQCGKRRKGSEKQRETTRSMHGTRV